MTCAVCGANAPIATNYLLPSIQRSQTGYVNAVACSLDCRDQWRHARTQQDVEVQQLLSSPAARASIENSRILFKGASL